MISSFILRDTVVAVKRILGLFWPQLCRDDWLAVYREILLFKNGHTAFEVKLYHGKQITALIQDLGFRQLTLSTYSPIWPSLQWKQTDFNKMLKKHLCSLLPSLPHMCTHMWHLKYHKLNFFTEALPLITKTWSILSATTLWSGLKRSWWGWSIWSWVWFSSEAWKGNLHVHYRISLPPGKEDPTMTLTCVL